MFSSPLPATSPPPSPALTRPVNHDSPISRLPFEILSQCFLAYAAATDSLAALTWTDLMLVCRRWRAIALGSPVLWSSVSVGFDAACGSAVRRRLTAQVARAKEHPLDVRINLTRDVAQLLEDFPRGFFWSPAALANCAFEAGLDPGAGAAASRSIRADRVLARMAAVEHPYLRAFSIDTSAGGGFGSLHVDVLPELIAPAVMPRLRVLRLANVYFTRELTGIGALAHLTDVELSVAMASPYVLRYTAVVHLLQHCRVLERFALHADGCVLALPTDGLPDTIPVAAPLKHVRFSGDESVFRPLLRRLRLPRTTELTIAPNVPSPALLAPTFSKFMRTDLSETLDYLPERDKTFAWTLALRERDLSLTYGPPTGAPATDTDGRIRLVFRDFYPRGLSDTASVLALLLPHLLTKLPGRIHALRCAPAHQDSRTDIWTTVVPALPPLATLELTFGAPGANRHAKAIVSALDKQLDRPDGPAPVRTVVVRCVSAGDAGAEQDGREGFDAVLAFVREAHAKGRALDSLVMSAAAQTAFMRGRHPRDVLRYLRVGLVCDGELVPAEGKNKGDGRGRSGKCRRGEPSSRV
ncbi:hypothetical protein K488DRAFT_86278 [Vararia minispora EC-137]|uniref:Uncharacterized protein n=1 Tax=Vararia minispora EC-137 TaxID=1314806 RepID=A0ACB8QJI5_9AGAM|nr:hypothetical protein K488DRAFT_86278 [Vararia minispora EC-137]